MSQIRAEDEMVKAC